METLLRSFEPAGGSPHAFSNRLHSAIEFEESPIEFEPDAEQWDRRMRHEFFKKNRSAALADAHF
jgi:hypothetical protein